ncbi:hypothetical protein H6P81_011370 [Aristolochia fimbriata]|uniref:Aminotransferase-like plant mobile domain-containing protein n=1 Tax=Aristolochia fimbriata TaxID=158543 RepID=A0AAV7ETI8_ARIFI|nr:hypothetical protein H6P81_011370 [Aristolochia fimbriata]
MVWRCASAQTMDEYEVAIQNLEEACPKAKAGLTEGMSPDQWALAYDGNLSFGKLTTNSSESVNSLLKETWSLPVQALASTIFYRVVMADTSLLYDQDSHRSEAIWHGEDPGCLECTQHFQTLRHWPMDERLLPYIDVAGFGALYRVQWLRLDKPLITSLVERWRSEMNTFHLANGEMTITLEDVVVLLGLRVDGFAVTGLTRGDWMELARDFQTDGRYSWGWATLAFLYRELVKACRTGVVGIAGCFTLIQHIGRPTLLEERAPQDGPLGSRWNVRRTNATNPCGNLVLYRTKLNHQRNYQLGCVRNVIEHVQRREVMDPLLAYPYIMEVGHYRQSILHSLPLLEGTIVGGDLSHGGEPSHVVEPTIDRAQRGRRARRRPTFETTLRVEDPDELLVVPEPTVLDLPPVQTPEPQPEQPPEPQPDRHPPIHRIYTRRHNKELGAPKPSSTL